MTKLKFGVAIAGVVVVLLLAVAALQGTGTLGGVYTQVNNTFREGIKVGTTDQFQISKLGALTGTTAAFTGAVSALVPVETMTADDTLTVAESGKTFFIGTAGVDLTLPTVATAAGVKYWVIISANFATTNATIITGGSANVIEGAVDVNSTLVPCAARDTISFVNSAESLGDTIELTSNGTNWFVTGQASTTGAITCTTAS